MIDDRRLSQDDLPADSGYGSRTARRAVQAERRRHEPRAVQKMDDQRIVENHLPIQTMSAEASHEKSVRKGPISTLHLWWARRPLAACPPAVYGAMVPEDLREVVWDPLGPDPELVRIQNPAARLDHAKREIVAARFFEIPAEAVETVARSQGEGRS